MTDYNEKIKRGLILWLREQCDIFAVDARIGSTEIENGLDFGCDCCGEDGTASTSIRYIRAGDVNYQDLWIDGTSIEFLPEILPYIDRAN